MWASFWTVCVRAFERMTPSFLYLFPFFLSFLNAALEGFEEAPPFTIQRLCEARESTPESKPNALNLTRIHA
jgi:hypothetical protein